MNSFKGRGKLVTSHLYIYAHVNGYKGNANHSLIQAISIAPLQVHYYSEALPTQHGYFVGVHAEVPQAIASEGLAQGPYAAARAGFDP